MNKTIGILGGMGPEATCDMYKYIISNTKATKDQEHIHVIIDSNPLIPDRTAAILNNSDEPIKPMVTAAKNLENAGANMIIISCNTAHYFVNEIQKQINVPIINMIETTCQHIKNNNINKVLVLCTEGTKKVGIYSTYLEKYNIDYIYPDQNFQNEINRIIYEGVKKGVEVFDTTLINEKLSEYNDLGYCHAILGCTELPIATIKYGLKYNFINPSEIVAKKAIELAGYTLK